MKPPRLVERWLASVVPDGASGPSVLGDLHEEYARLLATGGRVRADLWYAGQALAVGTPWAVRALVRSATSALRGLGGDLHASARGLLRTPLVALVAVTSLAIGSGLTTGALGVVNAIWMAPLPYPGAERLVDVEDRHPVLVCPDCSPGLSRDSWLGLQRDLTVFETLEAMAGGRSELALAAGGSGDEPDADALEVRTTHVSGRLMETLGLRTALGRGILPDDARPGAPPVAVLTHELWRGRFARDSAALGQTIVLGERAHTVVGVLAARTPLPDRGQVIVPLVPESLPSGFDERSLWTIGRLGEGVGIDAAREAADAWSRHAYAAQGLDADWYASVAPLRDELTAGAARPAAVAGILVLALLTLIVTSVNVASLLLARVSERQAELAVRAALGAGRLRVARAAVGDALLLATAGGVGGLLLAAAAASVAERRLAAELPGWITFGFDVRVLMCVLGVIALMVSVSGLFPLVRGLQAGRSIADRARGSRAVRGRLVAHDALLAVQVALGVVLVTGSISALGEYRAAADFDRLGFGWEGRQQIRVGVEGVAPDERDLALGELESALAAYPSIRGHALSAGLFLGSPNGVAEAPSSVRVDGRAEPVANRVVPRHSLAVGSGYFELYEIPILAGRAIADDDRPGDPPVAVVTEDAAHRLWPGLAVTEVLGRSFTVTHGDASARFTVVGVSASVLVNPLLTSETSSTPRIFTSLLQMPAAAWGGRPPGSITAHVDPVQADGPSPAEWTQWLARNAPELELRTVSSPETALRDWIDPLRVTGIVVGVVALFVLLLVALGIYGTVAYRIAASQREIGVRMALGARSLDVVGSVLRRLALVLPASALVGAVFAAWVRHSLAGNAIPLGSSDPGTALAAIGLLVVVGLVAAARPLRRATSVDPVTVLRAE